MSESPWKQHATDALLKVMDYVPDTVVFVKDTDRRYLHANETLLTRLHCPSVDVLVGKQVEDVFPSTLSVAYAAQDQAILTGHRLTEHLELHLYPSGEQGWCLTTKQPLLTATRQVRGLVGISRDVNLNVNVVGSLEAAVKFIHDEYAQPLTLNQIARHAGVSRATLHRQIRQLYHLSPKQLLMRVRLDAAARLLRETTWPVAQIAVECGYFDHSAFTRTFHTTTGLTPVGYRKLIGETGAR